MEAIMNAQWFERVLQEHHHELWIGDAAEIRAAMVQKQKTDSRDAWHILDLLLTNRSLRIWVPSPAERELRQVLPKWDQMLTNTVQVRDRNSFWRSNLKNVGKACRIIRLKS